MGESSATSSGAEELETLLARGSDLLQEDDVGGARKCFEEALVASPDDEKVLGLLGLTHFRLADFDAASDVYYKLVEKNAEDASYRLNLGLVHLKLGRADEAIQELSRARELDSSQIRTVSYLGLAYARNGAYAEAYEAFLQADESGLASEMEQYLDEEVQQGIRERVSGLGKAGPVDSVDSPMFASSGDSSSGSSSSGSSSSGSSSSGSSSSGASSSGASSSGSSSSGSSSSGSSSSGSSSSGASSSGASSSGASSSGASSSGASSSGASSAEAGSDEIVEPDSSAVPGNSDEVGMITRAVESVIPSESATGEIHLRKAGSKPEENVSEAVRRAPLQISEFTQQRLLRPDESKFALEIGAGGVLIAQVDGKLISRTHGVMVSSGELGFEPATKRIRGRQSDEVFGNGQAKLFVVTGQGYMVASACGEVFTALRLSDDVLYLREEYVFAFEPGLRWENGRVPGSEFQIAQFRGEGAVAIRTPKELLSIRLHPERVLYVESDVLAGWIGNVIPSFVKPAAGGISSTSFVECSGDGVVLMHDLQGNE